MNKIITIVKRIFQTLLVVFKLPQIYKQSRKSKNRNEHGKIFRTIVSLTIKSILFPTWNKEVSHSIMGMKIHGFHYGTMLYLFNEIFVNDEYDFTPSSKDIQIIDCGANIGMSILYFKHHFPNSKITAFEPNPHVFKLLQKTIEENELKGVDIFNLALSNKSEELEFYLPENIGSLGGSLIKERGGNNLHKVNAEQLSKFITDTPVSLIKMDVEGAEWSIFEDLISNNSLSNIDEILLEYHHKIENNKSVFSQFLLPLEKNGFEYNIRSHFEKKGGFQDIFLTIYKAN